MDVSIVKRENVFHVNSSDICISFAIHYLRENDRERV